MENEIKLTKIKKRDGSIKKFDSEKIKKAILKAFLATQEGDSKDIEKVHKKVLFLLDKRFSPEELPTVEQVQDLVEESLILKDFHKTAKAFILYRDSRRKVRETKINSEDVNNLINSYVDTSN